MHQPVNDRLRNGIWRQTLVAALALAVVAVIVAMVIRPPSPRPHSCIQVPELRQETDRKSAADMAAKLEGLELDVGLKAEFAELSKITFQQLTEKQAAFLLLLRAIDCYVEHADTPEKMELVKQIAPELIATARAMWAASHDLKGGTDERLSVKEIDILEVSPFGDEIFRELQEFGIEK